MMRAVAATALLAVAGCGGGRSAAKWAPSAAVSTSVPAAPPSVLRARAQAQSPARSHLIATIGRKSLGPFAARTAQGGIAAWIAPAERGGRQELVVVMLANDGAPLGLPQVVASIPEEATLLVVRPAGGSPGGWLLAWSGLLDRGESLSVLGLGPDGSTRAPAVSLQQTNDHIRWVDIVPTAHGGTCVWAEEAPAGGANLLAEPLDGDGKPGGVPVRVARGLDAWTAFRAVDGTGFALVAQDAKHAKPTAYGSLSWTRMDEAGRLATPIVLSAKPTVSGDVEVASTPDGWILAWTDRTGEDPQVMLAAVDAAGHVQGPTPTMNTFGSSALVGLVAGRSGAALLWEDPRSPGYPARVLHLATVSTSAGLSARAVSSFDTVAHTRPELVATGSGFALLTPARSCPTEERETPCSGPIVPTFIRLNADLQPTQTEPFFVGDQGARTTLAWALQCGAGDACVALAATDATPTPVFTVDLAPRASPYAAPSSTAPPPDAPRVSRLATIGLGQPYADVSASLLGSATLVATLTSASPTHASETASAAAPRTASAQRSRASSPDASVAVRLLDDRSDARDRWILLTKRAIAAGGLALSAGTRGEDGAAVAWTARDDGNQQVHLGHVDQHGRRTNEVQLTSAKGDASDVALAWVGDGWLVAWVDTREGNGEVYASKVDRDLRRVAREERITRAPGDAADVALAVQGETAWLAWSDPRESPREGLGDIYVMTLNTHDAKPVGPETRVLATASHSHSPCFAVLREGAILGWIEEGPTGLDAPGAALVARIDPRGRPVSAPSALPFSSPGRPTALTLAVSHDGAQAVVARSAREGIALEGVSFNVAGIPQTKAWPLISLEAPPSFDVALAMAGGVLFFDDTGAAPENRRLRRAAIAWRQ
ncbi:MAG: hypothetical protein M3O50_11075 [Myxococcota bacterium]|nr:hypothetical protein [Myxococcota bacterium]